MKLKNLVVIMVMASIVSLLLVSCTEKPVGPAQPVTPAKQPQTVTQGTTESSNTEELKKFNSASEIIDFLQKAEQLQGRSSYYGGGAPMLMREDVMMKSAAQETVGAAAPSAAPSAAGATEYSQTNVQVQGVDEADFVKNDNKYIYTIVQDKLVIVDAYPAENAKILSKTEIEGRPVQLFVNGDRLVLFVEDNEDMYNIPEYGYVPIPRTTQVTRVIIFDIKDRENPKEVEKFTLKGNYFQSRMIGDYVYFITQEGVYRLYDFVDMPMVKTMAGNIITPDVYYFDHPDSNYQFNTIASFNIKNPEINAKTFMMGYANTLYVSLENIYIAYQKSYPWFYYGYNNQDGQNRFYDVVIPLLPTETKNAILQIKNDNSIKEYEKWDKIASKLEDMYNNMNENDKNDLVDKIDAATKEYDIKQQIERSKTVIHKIKISDGNIEYQAKGEVPGSLLNQWSLDEYNGNLRVATTTQIWVPSGSEVYNNVYILDKDMKEAGKLEDIAPGERIYSTRFIGDRLYMVTFKRIDPLFVIDLSNPGNPKILGKLKIPGFSDYLHPYDATHIIGVGKETESNDWGGVSTGGVKLALFDVSDVENPKEIDHYTIGEAGSDSEALRDHKAFLFDKEKNVLVIPVRVVEGTRYYNRMYGYYTQKVWQGAYVFGVNPTTGFERRGKITHLEGDEEERYWYYSPSAVRRSLFMDDVLYTVSATTIKMNDIKTVKDINQIDLPYHKESYYDYPWWY